MATTAHVPTGAGIGRKNVISRRATCTTSLTANRVLLGLTSQRTTIIRFDSFNYHRSPPPPPSLAMLVKAYSSDQPITSSSGYFYQHLLKYSPFHHICIDVYVYVCVYALNWFDQNAEFYAIVNSLNFMLCRYRFIRLICEGGTVEDYKCQLIIENFMLN